MKIKTDSPNLSTLILKFKLLGQGMSRRDRSYGNTQIYINEQYYKRSITLQRELFNPCI